jgi:hypothetical protein
LQILDSYTRFYGNSYRLGGSCGGAVYSINNDYANNDYYQFFQFKHLSPLETPWRIFFNLFNRDEEYSFDHEGKCVNCGRKKMLGPCNICEECDKKLKDENKYEENHNF